MLILSFLNASLLLGLISPLLAAVLVSLTFFFNGTQELFEKITYRLVRLFYLFTFCACFLSLVAWFFTNVSYGSINLSKINLSKDFTLHFRLFYDVFGLVFLFSSSFITSIIIFFSHRYMHRDPGYRRFFITISLFAFGINLIVLAGNFDLLFAGWEIVGLSSFLLIGYFWHRPKAIDAASRAYYIYRFCDLGLLTSILITHFFWHDINIFKDFLNINSHSVLSHISISWRWLLSICILLSVLGKSAQFPFCFWLPKAMEGPTHSSAIFYGSLSVHIGVFLLIRTMPIWYFTPGFNYLLAAIGLITALCSTLFALVQSNIKGQIGYASIAQVGIMLIELSLGFTTIAFIHMIGNAFLRCFQLLVSSSILTTHLHMQNVVRTFGELQRFSVLNLFPKRIQTSLYIFAINDGFFEIAIKTIFVFPILKISKACNDLINKKILSALDIFFSNRNNIFRVFSPIFLLLVLIFSFDLIFHSNESVRFFSLLLGLILALAALGEKVDPSKALKFAILGNLFAFLSITSNKSAFLYLIGFLFSSFIALEALHYITARRSIKDLTKYQGLYQQFPLVGTNFLMGILGLVSFPFYSTFYGEDIVLSMSIDSGIHYLLIFQLIFILTGIALIHLYSLVLLGKRDNCIDVSLDLNPKRAFFRILLLLFGNLLAFFISR